MKKISKIIFIFICIFSFVLGNNILAQGIKNSGGILDTVAGKAGVTDQSDLGTIAGNAIGTILTLIGLIFLGLMVYGGITWMTARGNDEQVKKAQGIIRATIIGLVIVVSAYAITFFVLSRFTSL